MQGYHKEISRFICQFEGKRMMKIKLLECVGAQCSSIDDGQKVYFLLVPEFKEGRSVELDFQGVKSVLTPFLHNCIGRLLEAYQKETIMERLVLCNISAEHLKQVNLYIDRKDHEQFQNDSRNSMMDLFAEDELGDTGL
jgi:hypothetical protein